MEPPVWLRFGNLQAIDAWNHIEDYRAMATVQLSRVAQNNLLESLLRSHPEAERARLFAELQVTNAEQLGIDHLQSARFTADAHFYLNCWRIVALNVYRMAEAVGGDDLTQFLTDQQCPTNRRGNSLYFGDAQESYTLGWYAQGRDHFEHIDERIYGGRHWETLNIDPTKIKDLTGRPEPKDVRYYPSPFFNGTHMIVGNSRWEITPQAHMRLLAAVQKVEDIGANLLAMHGDEEAQQSAPEP